MSQNMPIINLSHTFMDNLTKDDLLNQQPINPSHMLMEGFPSQQTTTPAPIEAHQQASAINPPHTLMDDIIRQQTTQPPPMGPQQQLPVINQSHSFMDKMIMEDIQNGIARTIFILLVSNYTADQTNRAGNGNSSIVANHGNTPSVQGRSNLQSVQGRSKAHSVPRHSNTQSVPRHGNIFDDIPRADRRGLTPASEEEQARRPQDNDGAVSFANYCPKTRKC